MPTPYPVKFKLPLEFLTLQDWNNFVKNLLFLNQYGSAQLLKYYQNGSFPNINEVIAKYLYVSALKVAGYNVLHNLSEPLAYTFGEGNQQPFESMSNKPTVNFPYSIPFEFIQFYPITKLPNYQFPIFPIEKLQVQLSAVSKQLQLLIPRLTSKIVTPHFIAGTQFQFSGTANVQTLIENYLNPQYLESWREITIQNLGNSPVQINNSIYLMPKNCLKITASSPSEIQLTAQTPTLLSEEIEFVEIQITTYTITITNSQPDPTPSPFQQLLNLNLSSILSSSSQLLNLQFCLDAQCNTPLYAWIESYNSNLSSVYIWVNLPTSIPANSSITIYMFVRNSVQYPYTGIAPNLTSTYAQYDNGENVFTFYDNFAGTSLNTNKWKANSYGYYSVNNGLTVKPAQNTCSASPGEIISVQTFGVNTVFDFYGTPAFAGGTGWGYGSYGYNPGDAGCITLYGDIVGDANSGTSNVYVWTGTSSSPNKTQTSFTQTEGIYTIIQTSSEVIAMFNYGSSASTTSIIGSSSYPVGFYVGGGMSESAIILWARIRALPPNGVMPSNSQPQKTIILVS